MNRTRTQRHAEPIGAALNALTPALRERLAHVHYLAGSDPVFARLHPYADTLDGRSYRDTAHAVYPTHLEARPKPERVTHVVLPGVVAPWVVIHELGHALHETAWHAPIPEPITEYARGNLYEAFAEAFTALITPDHLLDYGDEGHADAYRAGRLTLARSEFSAWLHSISAIRVPARRDQRYPARRPLGGS